MSPALSICLPCFAQKPHALWREVQRQAQALGIAFEVIVAEDGSPAPYLEANRPQAEALAFRYFALRKNQGRAAIRNFLALEARGEYLLFLDGDLQLQDPKCLQKYWQAKLPQGIVLGGICSEAKTPPPARALRWVYSHQREIKSAALRAQKPYASFMTAAFLLHRSVMQQVQFAEWLQNYGHEDSLFGLQLAQKNIPILHIEAPIFHPVSEESNRHFLEKSALALHNLQALLREYPQFASHFGLYRWAQKVPRWLARGLQPQLAKWEKDLSQKPSLAKFDAWRLFYLAAILQGLIPSPPKASHRDERD